MSDGSTIEWTDATWNPIRGCKKISPGCKHCYAETFAERFRGVRGHPYQQGFDPKLVPEMLSVPLTWSKPRCVFVNSMSDLFQEVVPDEYIREVSDVMVKACWHTYQVLTKRSQRLRNLLTGPLHDVSKASHIWWGVSVEDRKYGIPRILDLQSTPAAIRFLSVEPLLEDLGEIPLEGIHWVIVGGESGPGAREMKKEWVINIREQCIKRNVKFFFKQWGGVIKKKKGRDLDQMTYNEMPSYSMNPIPDRYERKKIEQEILDRIKVKRFDLIRSVSKRLVF